MSVCFVGKRLGCRGAEGLVLTGLGTSGKSFAFLEGVPGSEKWTVFGRKLCKEMLLSVFDHSDLLLA